MGNSIQGEPGGKKMGTKRMGKEQQVSIQRDGKSRCKKNLVCMYTNTRSILSSYKRDELSDIMRRKGVDILGITESWAHEGISNAELELTGYNMFRKDRSKGVRERGGGVLLYVKKSILALQSEDSASGCEALWVKLLRGGDKDVMMGVCYRCPHATKDESRLLYTEIERFAQYVPLVVMGDFNLGEIDWVYNLGGSGEGQEFLDTVGDCFLTQKVLTPTRGGRILDLVLCSEPDLVENLEVGCPVANSDHKVLEFLLSWGGPEIDQRWKNFKYHKGNYDKIRSCIIGENWEDKLRTSSVERGWELFKERLCGLRDKWVPRAEGGETKNNRGTPKWMNGKIRKGIEKREQAWKRLIKSPSYLLDAKYKLIRNKVTKMIRKAKMKFEVLLANRIKEDAKTFYAYVKSKAKGRGKVGPLKDGGGRVVSDNKGMGDMFNEFFGSVFTKEDIFTIPRQQVLRGEGEIGLSDIVFLKEKIVKEIKGMKENKAAGDDGLGSTFIKEIEEAVTDPLTVLFSKSMEDGVVPIDWKRANITPVYKKGAKHDPGNYRPVSLTSQVGKIMERVIKRELVEYLEGRGLLRESQHGFRGGKSCLSNLLSFIDDVSGRIDRGEKVDVVFLDFRKAFDTVPHARLMVKLETHGVGGKVLRWIGEWLKGRKQRVVLNGVESEWKEVLSGVPQGSILGPVLFLVFVNDLDKDIFGRVWKFADDVKLIGNVGTNEGVGMLKEDLHKMERWAEDWQMGFNVDKCKVMGLGSKNAGMDYTLDGSILERVQEEKDLGIVVCSKLKVSRQCGKAAARANQVLGMIHRTFSTRSRGVMMKLYKALVRPHLEYCGPAWRPHLKGDVERLERVQRRATRGMDGFRGVDYEGRLQELGLMSLETRRKRADLIEVFKILRGITGAVQGMGLVRDEGGRRGHEFKLYKGRVRLDVGKFMFRNRVCDMWNALPQEVVGAESVNAFKRGVDKYLRGIRG